MAASDPAKKLGEKLLQGWCMLDKTCDTCYVPIMRDRNNREYCVGCESYMDQPRARQAQEELSAFRSTREKLSACHKLKRCLRSAECEL